jgi:hypothetical protein
MEVSTWAAAISGTVFSSNEASTAIIIFFIFQLFKDFFRINVNIHICSQVMCRKVLRPRYLTCCQPLRIAAKSIVQFRNTPAQALLFSGWCPYQPYSIKLFRLVKTPTDKKLF